MFIFFRNIIFFTWCNCTESTPAAPLESLQQSPDRRLPPGDLSGACPRIDFSITASKIRPPRHRVPIHTDSIPRWARSTQYCGNGNESDSRSNSVSFLISSALTSGRTDSTQRCGRPSLFSSEWCRHNVRSHVPRTRFEHTTGTLFVIPIVLSVLDPCDTGLDMREPCEILDHLLVMIHAVFRWMCQVFLSPRPVALLRGSGTVLNKLVVSITNNNYDVGHLLTLMCWFTEWTIHQAFH